MRLIDENALRREIAVDKYGHIETTITRLNVAIERSRVDAEPVRHGRWMKGGYVCGETEWICSVCGKTEWRTNCNRMKYCMFCGAKMDEGEDDAETDM